jgi:hypothetical protein
MLVGALVGALLGAAAVGLVWWQADAGSSEPAAADEQPSSSPSASSAKSAADRGEVATARTRPTPPTAPPSTDPVLLVGDSLAVGIAPYVDAGLGERPLTVEAAEGRGTGTQVGLLEGYAAASPPIWVVSLGTNDNPEDFADVAPEVLRLAGPDRCVVWFDVWRTDTDEEVNATLDTLALKHDNLHLVPWHDTSELHAEWFSGYDVHPSSDGYAVRGQMAIDAVATSCDSG